MKAFMFVLLQCVALYSFGCACPESHDVEQSTAALALEQEACPAGLENVRAYFNEGAPFRCNWFEDDFGVCDPTFYVPEYPNEPFYVMATGSKGLGQFDIWTRDVCDDEPTCGVYTRWKHATCNCVDVFEGACRVWSYAPPWF